MNESLDSIYKALFRRYYPSLIFYATRLVGEEEAEDVAQDVFVEPRKRKDSIEIGEQTQVFLYRTVYTRALNVLKYRNVEDGYYIAMEEINRRRAEFYQPDNNEVIRKVEDRELRKETHDAINELPDKCKEALKLSYLHDMKNKEIADVLGVSLRMIEAHMYKALKFLRNRLRYLWSILLLFLLDQRQVFSGFQLYYLYEGKENEKSERRNNKQIPDWSVF